MRSRRILCLRHAVRAGPEAPGAARAVRDKTVFVGSAGRLSPVYTGRRASIMYCAPRGSAASAGSNPRRNRSAAGK